VGDAQRLQQLLRIGRVGVERGEQLHRLTHPQLVRQLALLQLSAELACHTRAIGTRVHSEHRHLPPVRHPQAFDALDGGRLARAVGAEDAEDLALLDGERHVVDRYFVAVAFVQPLYFDYRHIPPSPRPTPSASNMTGVGRIRSPVRSVSTDRLMSRSTDLVERGQLCLRQLSVICRVASHLCRSCPCAARADAADVAVWMAWTASCSGISP